MPRIQKVITSLYMECKVCAIELSHYSISTMTANWLPAVRLDIVQNQVYRFIKGKQTAPALDLA